VADSFLNAGHPSFPPTKVSGTRWTRTDPPRRLLAREEYDSGSKDDEPQSEDGGVAAIATTSSLSTSLFGAPNDNAIPTNQNYLMAKATEVILSSTPLSHSKLHSLVDVSSTKVKKEMARTMILLLTCKGRPRSMWRLLCIN
jgi:hypothetical protein